MKPYSLRMRLTLFVLATTAFALLLSAGALLAYEVYSYRRTALQDLSTQAELVAQTSTAALLFNDQKAAQENLALLRLRPQILAAVIYSPLGVPFATYRADSDVAEPPPARAPPDGTLAEGDLLQLSQSLRHEGETVGSLLVRARYDLQARVLSYISILAAAMLASLALAGLVWSRLQRTALEPVHALSRAARDVVKRGDYSVQVARTKDDELGAMVDAFNAMLQEVARRAAALERVNVDLVRQVEQTDQAQTALRQADRRKDEFLATLAHELRNPLAPITNALYILKLKQLDDPQMRQARDVMERQVRHMARLIDDLLDVARITRGHIDLRKERLDLVGVARTAIEVAQPVLAGREHQLEFNAPDQPIWLMGDATRLAQVIANLLNNAAAYTPPNGFISICVKREATADGGEEAVLAVRDNGIGIATEHLETVFEMFSQLDSRRDGPKAGLGIGLALCRALVRQHGGSIVASSVGHGLGSVFTFRLPIDPALLTAEQTAASSAAPIASAIVAARLDAPGGAREAPIRPAGARRFMVVDDNVDAAESLALLLGLRGYEVAQAYDGAAALELGATWKPDVVLMDIGMPVLNGYETAVRVRATPWGRDTMLVAVTGWGQPRDRARATAAGFDHHLTKPIDIGQLDRLLHADQASL